MKTTYWLVTAAAVAAAGVTVYARLTAGDPPLPKVPAVAEAPRDVPYLPLPPVVLPPDESAGPAVPDVPAAPMPLPGGVKNDTPMPPVPGVPVPTMPTGPSIPGVPPIETTSGVAPLVPPLPVVPAKPPAASEVPPFEPLVPPTSKPETPALPSTPPPATAFVPPLPPTPAPLPVGPGSVLQPPVPSKPLPLPAPTPVGDPGPREPLAVVGKYVLLKNDKLIEGTVSVNNDTVIVRQGALDRPFHKSQVQYVAASRDEVYRFMREKVPATDPTARLQVAKWCMFSGLREQALAEAREVQKLQPMNRGATDMIRSLELSLRQFPAEDSPKMSAPATPTFPAELKSAPVPPIPPATAVADPDPDVTPEAALVFASRVQPFLANQCVECHAKADYAGKFKLVRVTPQDAGPQATRTNLRAVANQLRKDDPATSPLLMKALTAHGGMKLPAIASRQAAAYLGLEGWTALAVGTPIAATPAPPVPPVSPVPVAPPVADPLLPLPNPPAPPVAPLPPIDPVAPLPVPLGPAVPPLVPVDPVTPLPKPVKPEWPPVTPVVPNPALPDPLLPLPVPAVPTPAPLPKPVVPAIPPADNFAPIPAPPPKPVAPPAVPVPAIPPIPPAAGAPKLPSGVVPASGTQFGSTLPPKPPVTGPAGDEFDPSNFNAQPPRK